MIRDWVAGVFYWLLGGGLLLFIWSLTLAVAVQVGRRWGRREQARRAVREAVQDATVRMVPTQRGGEE